MERLKTGTTTVGIVCREGIVLAADKRATAGNYIMDKDVQKIWEITPDLAVTMAGVVSDIQLMLKLIRSEINLKKIRNNREVAVKEAANLLSGIVFESFRQYFMQSISHFLLAGRDSTGFYLFDIPPDGSLTHKKDFTSSGSGSIIAYGVLETMYKETMTVDEAVELAIKAVNAAMRRDSASGNGLDVVTITKEGLKWVFRREIDINIV